MMSDFMDDFGLPFYIFFRGVSYLIQYQLEIICYLAP